MEIRTAIESKNINFFDTPLKEYRQTKINHLSILGYAIYHGNYAICEKIIEKNKQFIFPVDLEEDGFKTVIYVLDCPMSYDDKVKLLNLFHKALRENFDFSKMHTNFIGYCIAINQLKLLLYIYQNFLKEKEDLLDFYPDIEDKLLSQDLELLHEYKTFLKI